MCVYTYMHTSNLNSKMAPNVPDIRSLRKVAVNFKWKSNMPFCIKRLLLQKQEMLAFSMHGLTAEMCSLHTTLASRNIPSHTPLPHLCALASCYYDVYSYVNQRQTIVFQYPLCGGRKTTHGHIFGDQG